MKRESLFQGGISMSRGILCALLLLTSQMTFAAPEQAPQKAISSFKIASFNIRWFGRAESNPQVDPNVRKNEVRAFINERILPADIIAFEEIVDKAMLQSILPPGWTCASYDLVVKVHQYVMLCVQPQLQLTRVAGDNNNIIDEVAFNKSRSRPAVRMDVKTIKGQLIARVIAVHFKAAPDFSPTREMQMGLVAEDLAKNATVPTIVTGDFNAYPASQSGMSLDDTALLLNQLTKADSSFKLVPSNLPASFRSPTYGASHFDHFFANDSIAVVGGTSKVFSQCATPTTGERFDDFNYYYTTISDHCPIKMEFRVRSKSRRGG